jgi:hypothetical protein
VVTKKKNVRFVIIPTYQLQLNRNSVVSLATERQYKNTRLLKKEYLPSAKVGEKEMLTIEQNFYLKLLLTPTESLLKNFMLTVQKDTT